MVRFIPHRHRGYTRAVHPRPSQRLIEKLKRLGWKEGQYIYWDMEGFELRFFDSKEQLHDFLDRKLPDARHLDCTVDLDLQIEEFSAR